MSIEPAAEPLPEAADQPSAASARFLSPKVRDMPPSGIRRFFDMLNEMKDVISLTIGEPDFKGDVRKAFCKETGKLCPKAK